MHLTIGVTGHRDLLADEVPVLKQMVQNFFLQLISEYPDLDVFDQQIKSILTSL